jgi:hypothetical protein
MSAAAAETRIAELEAVVAAQAAALAAERQRIAELTRGRDLLRASHERLRYELELLRRPIFVAKAERVDTAQLEMEFAEKLAALDRLGGGPPPARAETIRERPRPTGRRDLRDLKLPVERIEAFDPIFEKLVAEGNARRAVHAGVVGVDGGETYDATR